MKKVIALIILSSALLSGCSSTTMGWGVSPMQIIEKTEPRSTVQLSGELDETFNCIKLSLLIANLRSESILEWGDRRILYQVGAPMGGLSFVDSASLNAVYSITPDKKMEIYVQANLANFKNNFIAIGENCAKDTSWQATIQWWRSI